MLQAGHIVSSRCRKRYTWDSGIVGYDSSDYGLSIPYALYPYRTESSACRFRVLSMLNTIRLQFRKGNAERNSFIPNRCRKIGQNQIELMQNAENAEPKNFSGNSAERNHVGFFCIKSVLYIRLCKVRFVCIRSAGSMHIV